MTLASNSHSPIHLLVPMAEFPVTEPMPLELARSWQRHLGPDHMMSSGPPLLEGDGHDYD